MFERLTSVRNDVGLLSEEFDPVERSQAGNFPQAFSHLALVGTALALSEHAEARDSPSSEGEPSTRCHLGPNKVSEDGRRRSTAPLATSRVPHPASG